MFDTHKARHFYMKTDKGIQRMLRVLIYHLVSLVRLLRKWKPCLELLSWWGHGGNQRFQPQGWALWLSFAINWECFQSFFSGKKWYPPLLSKSHLFFWIVSIVTVVELSISFNGPERNNRISLLMWVTVSTIAWWKYGKLFTYSEWCVNCITALLLETWWIQI